MIAHTSAIRPADREHGAEDVEPRRGRVAGLRDEPAARRSGAAATNGTLTRKIQLQSACSMIQPPATGPIAMPRPDTPAQIPIAFARSFAGNVAVRIDSVEGMMNAPPTPISARLAINIPAEPATADSAEPSAEDREAEVQRPAAAEAVTERAGREQQAGEDEHVGVDDPLELRARGMKVALERGQRNIEDRVVERDDEQREAEDEERPPAAGIGGVGFGRLHHGLLKGSYETERLRFVYTMRGA